MCIISLNEEKNQAFFWCIVCPSTLFRPREIALFLIWQLTTGVYPPILHNALALRFGKGCKSQTFQNARTKRKRLAFSPYA